MNHVILLIKEGEILKSFCDWDWATLQLLKINHNVNESSKAKLVSVPFEGEVENTYPADIEITHVGNEILFMYLGEVVTGEITLEKATHEERFHESCPPDEIVSVRVSEVHIHNENIDKISISKELKREIEAVAECYSEEVNESKT